MKKCPYCGHENDDNAVCCERCYAGFPVEENDNKKQEEPIKEQPVVKKRTRS